MMLFRALGAIARHPVKALKALSAMTHPITSNWWMGWSEAIESDYVRKVGDGLDANVITSPILWIARSFQEARLAARTEKPDGETVVDRGHEMAQLVRRPNKVYTGDAMWTAILLSLLTDGNAYLAKVRIGVKVAELWYLPHWMVNPVGDERTFIKNYEYSPGGTKQVFLPEDVVHFRYGMDPRNPRKGFAPLGPIITEVFSDLEAASLVAALLKNRGIPGIVISPEKDVAVSPEDAQAMKDYVADGFTGAKRGKPLVVTGATKVQTFGFSPTELDVSALRNVSEERVCAALGLPAAVVGFGSGLEQTKVGATMKEMVRLAWTGCLLPIQRMLAADLTLQLLPDFDDDPRTEAYFDTSNVEALSADMVQVAQATSQAVQAGVMMRSDARRALNLETGPEDDIYLIPMGVIEVPKGQLSTDFDQAIQIAPEPTKRLKPSAKRLTRMQTRLVRARMLSYKRHVSAMGQRMKTLLDEFGADVERAYLGMPQPKALAVSGNGHGRKADASEDDLNLIARLFYGVDLQKQSAKMRAAFGAQYVAVHKDNVLIHEGVGIAVDVPDSVQFDIFSRGGTRAGLVDLTEAGKTRAFDVIRAAREEGLGVEATGRRLRDSVPAGPFLEVSTRAELIARTETRYAQNASSLAMYSEMDNVESVMMLDNRLGPQPTPDVDGDGNECADINGLTVTIQEAQRLIDVEHPNGTRDMVPVVA